MQYDLRDTYELTCLHMRPAARQSSVGLAGPYSKMVPMGELMQGTPLHRASPSSLSPLLRRPNSATVARHTTARGQVMAQGGSLRLAALLVCLLLPCRAAAAGYCDASCQLQQQEALLALYQVRPKTQQASCSILPS